MFLYQNHASGGGNGSIMVEMFVCLCLASQKTSEREFFVPARTDLGVKRKVVPDTFSGCYKQRIVAPDLFPLKSSEKIPVLIKRWVSARDANVPSPGPPELLFFSSSHLRSVAEAPNMAGMANRA
jgi:hypothetical protein